MKTLTILMTMLFLFTNSANSGENTYSGQLDDCRDYKLSPNFLICKISKAGSQFKRKLTKKEDGSDNLLNRWFKSKSLSDFKK